MKPETLKALRESIAHWRRMRDTVDWDETPRGCDCPLCERFCANEPHCELAGEKCPVYEKTGKGGCFATPWAEANSAYSQRLAYPEDWKYAADKMIKFLESLVPVENETSPAERSAP